MRRHTITAHREIALVVTLFVALGIFYSVTTPLFEAPDEQWHFAFVQYVATGRGLPVQSEPPTHLARQEGSQPPLYYLLAAAATGWIDTSDFPGIVWENPHYGYNVPGIINDNKNLFIHTSLESFPYHGAALAIHIARLLSILMGALAVWFTYRLTLEIFPNRKYLAASAAALLAFVPQFLFISSAVSNDSTIVAMSALSLWMMVRILTNDRRRKTEDESGNLRSFVVRRSSALALGAVTGLAALAKVSGLGLALLGALVLVWVSCRQSEWDADDRGRTRTTSLLSRASDLVRVLIPFGLAFAVVAGWWYARNVVLYGELTGTATMVRIFGARTTPLTTAQWLTQLHEVWETFWVGFGWGNIRAQPVIYNILGFFAALSGIGLVLGLVRRRGRLRATRSRTPPLVVLALWIVIVLVELLNWMETTQAPHGRLFFPALPALAPLAALGLVQWAPARAHPAVARGVALALFAFAAIAPLAILEPAYAYPPFLAAVPAISHRVDLNYENKMKLLGYDLAPDRAHPGEWATLTLYWQSLTTMDRDYSIGIHLVDSNQRVISARDSYPGHGLLPTRLWRAGQILRDAYWLPIAGDAPAPSVASIQISLYSLPDRRELSADDPNGRTVSPPVVGRLKITGGAPVTARPQNTTADVFGNQIELLGYDLAPRAETAPGFDLTLYWKRRTPLTDDYTVFVHIVDASGKIIAQQDQQPDNGNNPTSLWGDEVIVDHYSLPVPETRSAYRIELGLYDARTGARLSVTDAQKNALGDHVTLEVGR
jgi:hypothetical protein